MMKKSVLSFVMILAVSVAMKTDKPAYQFFNLKGKAVEYDDVLKHALESDIVFFGEMHDSPICHWMELELTKDIYNVKKDNVVMGAEMFETDNQLILNEYLAGKVKERNFEDEAKLWKNYRTDYKPLVKFALDHKIPFIATNVPRRYAALVNHSGFAGLDSLSDEAKAYLPPLPVPFDPELKIYKDMMSQMGDMGGHASPNITQAQAIKDATMAYYILKNWQKGKIFIHYNGTYHSNYFEGIVWYIRQQRPDIKIMTIASVEQDNLDSLSEENSKLADFTLCIPSSMSKSY